MDTSNTYIKMCEKAAEIQRLWVPKEGDFIVNLSAVGGPLCYINHKLQPENDRPDWRLLIEDNKQSFNIWLPRQDQLQEMIDNTAKGPIALIKILYTRFALLVCPIELLTIEQILLYFLMERKYRKRWNGEDWK